MQELKLKMTGVSPLILHNGQMADPQNEWAKELKAISGKRHKVDADLDEMSRIEYFAGLYMTDNGPCLTDLCIEACIIAGAKKFKRGPDAKAGIFADGHADLVYDGPRSPEGLFEDKSFVLRVPVKVGQSKVVRTRPIFRSWSCVSNITYDEDVIDENEIIQFAEKAGHVCGIGDWRPKHGRFSVEKI